MGYTKIKPNMQLCLAELEITPNLSIHVRKKESCGLFSPVDVTMTGPVNLELAMVNVCDPETVPNGEKAMI